MPCEINYHALKQAIADPAKADFFNLLSYSCKKSYQKLIRVLIEPLKNQLDFMLLYEAKYSLDNLDFNYLKHLPEETLGYQYASLLEKNELTLLAQKHYPRTQVHSLLSYTKKILTSTHDILHVVGGYETDFWGEMAIQAFMIAQVKSPLALVLLGSGLIHVAVEFPEKIDQMLNLIILEYQKGQSATNILTVNWHQMFPEPLTEVRKKLNFP
jgi:ubiquinone biosynthesis protein COQ4